MAFHTQGNSAHQAQQLYSWSFRRSVVMSNLQLAMDKMEMEKKAQLSKVASKPRLTADPTVGTGEIQDVIRKYLKVRNTKDLWSVIQPGPSGPRCYNFKTRPNAEWLIATCDLCYDLLDLAHNTKLSSKKTQLALSKLITSGEVVNDTKKTDSDLVDTMDQTVRILLSMWREVKQCAEKRSCVLRRLSSSEQAKCHLILNKIKLPGSFEEDEEENSAPEVMLSIPPPSTWTNTQHAIDKDKSKDKNKRSLVLVETTVQKKSRSSLSFKDCMKALGVEEKLIAGWSPEPLPAAGAALDIDDDDDDDSDEVDDGMKDFDLIKRVQFLGSSRSAASSSTRKKRAKDARSAASSSTCAKPETKAKAVSKPKAKQSAKPEAKAAAKPATTKPRNFAALLNDFVQEFKGIQRNSKDFVPVVIAYMCQGVPKDSIQVFNQFQAVP